MSNNIWKKKTVFEKTLVVLLDNLLKKCKLFFKVRYIQGKTKNIEKVLNTVVYKRLVQVHNYWPNTNLLKQSLNIII